MTFRERARALLIFAAALTAASAPARAQERRVAVVIDAADLEDHRIAILRTATEDALRDLGHLIVSQEFGEGVVPPRELGACADRGAECVLALLSGRGIDEALYLVVRSPEPRPAGGGEVVLLVRLFDAGTGELMLVDRRVCPKCVEPGPLIELIEEMAAELVQVEAADAPEGEAAPASGGEVRAAFAQPSRPQVSRPFRILKYVTVGVGAGSVATGLALIALDDSSAGRRTRGEGIAFTAVGAGLVVGGVMMWLHDDRARSRARANVAAVPTPGGVLFTAAARF